MFPNIPEPSTRLWELVSVIWEPIQDDVSQLLIVMVIGCIVMYVALVSVLLEVTLHLTML